MCGLTGYSGSNFDVNKFDIIGISMESRGTDSTGIAFGNKIFKSLKRYFKLRAEIELSENYSETIKTAMAHCRRKSSGAIEVDNAHPFRVEMYDNPDDAILLMHNGTIKEYNKRPLCKFLDIDYSKLKVDSQIFAHCLAKGSTDAFKYYEGSATCIWRKKSEPDTLYVYVGGPEGSEIPDRTLFYIQDGGMYISSEYEPLEIILNGKKRKQVKEFPINTIVKVKNGRITKKTPIKREDLPQPPKEEKATQDIYVKYKDYKQKSLFYLPPRKANTWDLPTNPQNQAKGKVYWYNDNYYRNGHILDGEMWLNDDGEFTLEKDGGKSYWFFDGLLVKSKNAYNKLKELSLNRFQTGNTFFCEALTLIHPNACIINQVNNRMYSNRIAVTSLYFKPLFSPYCYDVNDGYFRGFTNYGPPFLDAQGNFIVEENTKEVCLGGECSTHVNEVYEGPKGKIEFKDYSNKRYENSNTFDSDTFEDTSDLPFADEEDNDEHRDPNDIYDEIAALIHDYYEECANGITERRFFEYQTEVQRLELLNALVSYPEKMDEIAQIMVHGDINI